jgi:ADP-ribosyl-[dinitrogen reductase] hydrolase
MNLPINEQMQCINKFMVGDKLLYDGKLLYIGVNMLLELAIGDAYGAGFEYVSNKIIQENNNLSGYIKHQRHDIKPGHYTDDTQMTLAIAEAMLSGKPWTSRLLADYFVVAFKRDPREGYASNFFAFLSDVSSGDEFLHEIVPTSEKSGAAMRSAPIGLYRDIKQVIEYSTIQAKVTHDTTLGINAAVAASLMTHYFRYDLGSKNDLGDFLKVYIEGDWNKTWSGKVGALGVMSVAAAITAILSCDSMSELLKKCINFSGDVDTVATIALAAACFSKEIKQDLPSNLYDNLERSTYGYDYLVQLDQKLININ